MTLFVETSRGPNRVEPGATRGSTMGVFAYFTSSPSSSISRVTTRLCGRRRLAEAAELAALEFAAE